MSKRFQAAAGAAAAAVSLVAVLAPLARAADPLVVIRAGRLLDGRTFPARRDQLIVVRGHRIEAVRDAAAGGVPELSLIHI